VRQLGKGKVWYGICREDVKMANGKIKRSQRQVRLGTPAELSTKNAARAKLADLDTRESEPTRYAEVKSFSARSLGFPS
jgi:hypothetical protein